MGDAELKEVLRLQRQADKLYDAGDEEAASKAHKPNLLNTIIWLVETAQQVSVMLVNYKGRPWMKGATENPGLLYPLQPEPFYPSPSSTPLVTLPLPLIRAPILARPALLARGGGGRGRRRRVGARARAQQLPRPRRAAQRPGALPAAQP